jgi:hypothetical protein
MDIRVEQCYYRSMPDPFTPLDKAGTWLLDHYFDVLLTLVVETRSWFAAGEALAADLEHMLYRWQNHKV